MQPRQTRPGIAVLRASLHSQLVASNLEMADHALGYQGGTPSHRYGQLAEEAIGRLDPELLERAEHEAARMLLNDLADAAGRDLTPHQRHTRARFALRRAVVVYEQILGGRQVDPDETEATL
jgi:hypothetical protein